MEFIQRDVWSYKILQPFDSILWEWINILERLTREWTRKNEIDFPWWYNERACVGMLAAAIWRSGGTAFEEYISEKIRDHSKFAKEEKPNPGRTDLHISHYGYDYICEAKQWWPELKSKSSESYIKGLDKALEEAKYDAKAVNEDSDSRLSIVFAIPQVSRPAVEEDKQLEDLVKEWIDAIDDNDYSARALFFPKIEPKAKDDNWYYPGIGIFLEIL